MYGGVHWRMLPIAIFVQCPVWVMVSHAKATRRIAALAYVLHCVHAWQSSLTGMHDMQRSAGLVVLLTFPVLYLLLLAAQLETYKLS